jgi:hypothetical protein
MKRSRILRLLGGRWAGLVLVWITGCTPQSSSAAPGQGMDSGPDSGTSKVLPSSAPGRFVSGGVVPSDLAGVLRLFPQGEITEAAGPASLRTRLGELLRSMQPAAGHAPRQAVFVVDRSLPENLAPALEWALAGNREQLEQGGAFALVSYGNSAGAGSAQVEAPLEQAPYALLKAVSRLKWSPEGSGLGGSGTALQEVMRLDWQPGRSPHIVLLTNDVPRPDLIPSGVLPPAPVAQTWEDIAAWAHRTGAILHGVRCRLELADGRGTDVDAPPLPGMPPGVASGLFWKGRHVQASFPKGMEASLQAVLEASSSSEGPVDVVLAIDSTGLMGEALRSLEGAAAVLERFVSSPGRRLALIRWGDGSPQVRVNFIHQANTVRRALAAWRPGPRGDPPKDAFSALVTATKLVWRPAARKEVLVLTAAPVSPGASLRAVLDWAEREDVTVTFIEPVAEPRPPPPGR